MLMYTVQWKQSPNQVQCAIYQSSNKVITASNKLVPRNQELFALSYRAHNQWSTILTAGCKKTKIHETTNTPVTTVSNNGEHSQQTSDRQRNIIIQHLTNNINNCNIYAHINDRVEDSNTCYCDKSSTCSRCICYTEQWDRHQHKKH